MEASKDPLELLQLEDVENKEEFCYTAPAVGVAVVVHGDSFSVLICTASVVLAPARKFPVSQIPCGGEFIIPGITSDNEMDQISSAKESRVP